MWPDIRWITAFYSFDAGCTHIGVPRSEDARDRLLEMAHELVGTSRLVAIYVPLALGALMVIGVLMSINYGRLAPAILKMSAITFTVNGIWLVGEWMRLPVFLIAPISCLVRLLGQATLFF